MSIGHIGRPVWWYQLQMWGDAYRDLKDRHRALEQTHAVIVDRWLAAEERVRELEGEKAA